MERRAMTWARRIVRLLMSLVIVASAGVALKFLCAAPFEYNRDRVLIERAIGTIEAVDAYRKAITLRTQLELLRTYEHLYPIDVSIYIDQALIQFDMGDDESALRAWTRGLRFDKRPEMYAGMAGAALRLGRRDEALKDLVIALKGQPTIEYKAREFILDTAFIDQAVALARHGQH
jgi:tetratricopeptide (TPR) repeat protein